MGRDFYAQVFYGCVFTLEEAIANKNITHSPEMEKYMEGAGKEAVRDYLYDIMNETFGKKISLNNSSLPWIEEGFYVFASESVMQVQGGWVIKLKRLSSDLNDLETDICDWCNDIREFCNEHNIPFKGCSWNLQLASF